MKAYRVGLLLVGMVAILMVYVWTLARKAFFFFSLDTLTSWGVGSALLAMLGLSVWAIFRELAFGFQSQRLTKLMVSECDRAVASAPEAAELQALVYRQLSRQEALVRKEQYEHASERFPTDWKSWYQLGLVYEACGQRTQARAAVRQAIIVFRTSTVDQS